MSTLTPEQIQAGTKMLLDLRAHLASKPGRGQLKDSFVNGHTIVHEVTKRGLSLTLDSALQVINAILFEDRLEWDVEPVKLVAQKPKTTIICTVPELGNSFEARVRAGEKKNEKKVADIKTFQRIDEAISTLSLHFKSDTASQQTRLR